MDLGTTQPEKLFEKSPRDDEPEPPKGHPPRFHRFDPWLAEAAALRRGLTHLPSRTYDLLHNRPRKREGIIDDDGRAGRRLAPGSGAAAPPAENDVMLTVFLKHDRSRR
jgi:hypothetical protein